MNRRRTQRGFTLIEVLIALVVLSVGIGAMIPVLLHSIRGNSFGSATTRAASYSQDKLEELRRADFDDPALTPTTGTPHTDTLPPPFTRSWEVHTGAGTAYGPDLKGIEVTTSWTDAQGSHVARAFTVKANFTF
jgi:type IV pilus assembly protein PilV